MKFLATKSRAKLRDLYDRFLLYISLTLPAQSAEDAFDMLGEQLMMNHQRLVGLVMSSPD